ncbi:hypothetical protein EV06_1943 [Prochlorococcus sp. MIT 0602]|nr:hypothetical protein EV06_1943 [Prochlorococcus sp. MIT 0602]KGG15688.1 hypothetical protein EV07_1653 [Prochlorococcus sp. MIT 0603]
MSHFNFSWDRFGNRQDMDFRLGISQNLGNMWIDQTTKTSPKKLA